MGQSTVSINLVSISKQSGPLISSKLIIAKDGDILRIYSINFLGSFSCIHTTDILVPPKYLNKTLFPYITGIPAKAPISPRPKTAVPFVTIAP